MLLLEVKDLYKSFGNVDVLKGLNLTLEPGMIYTVTGGNGSGKTTLLNIVSGFLKPDRGSVVFMGQDLVGKWPHEISNLGIKRAFQDLRIIKGMTVEENLLLNMGSHTFPNRASKMGRITKLLEILHFDHMRNVPAGNMSTGQIKLLTLACCVADGSAFVYLFDEPASALDLKKIECLLAMEKKMKEDGKTILQVGHDWDFIDQISDKIFELKNGQLHVVR